jgi:hypothetical protein
MEDAQGSYSHGDEVIGLHVSVGNAKIKSNGHKNIVEPVELVETMRSLQKEAQSYRADNEKMMRTREELLQSLNMLHKKVNKDSSTKQAVSAKQVEVSRSHDRRNDHEGSRQSRSISRHHHC